jgi:protein SCO1/2
MNRIAFILSILALGIASSLPAHASDAPFFKGDVQAPAAQQGLPKIEQNVGFDQHLGQQITLSLPVRDEHGTLTTLGSYFGKRPVILVMAYYECPNLCTMVMNGVFSAMKTVPFVPGKDYEVVSVSINPHETSMLALQKKNTYLSGYHEQQYADGYHFLTADESTIQQLTKEIGFRYAYDTEGHQYAHASGIVIVTPGGQLSRYLFGVQYAPNDL